MPFKLKVFSTKLVTLLMHLPIPKLGYLLTKIDFNTNNFPLTYYSDKPLYFIRNDSLGRFVTRLKNRYSTKEILEIFNNSGFIDVQFSYGKPYWCACGIKE